MFAVITDAFAADTMPWAGASGTGALCGVFVLIRACHSESPLVTFTPWDDSR